MSPVSDADIDLAILPSRIHENVERWAALTPNAIAVAEPDGLSLTYRELNKAIGDLQRATGNSLKENNVQARLRK